VCFINEEGKAGGSIPSSLQQQHTCIQTLEVEFDFAISLNAERKAPRLIVLEKTQVTKLPLLFFCKRKHVTHLRLLL
jgi:hypothetical protein